MNEVDQRGLGLARSACKLFGVFVIYNSIQLAYLIFGEKISVCIGVE